MTLPLPLRNRLAGLILDGFHDAEARQGLGAIAAVCAQAGAPGEARALPAGLPGDVFEHCDGAPCLRDVWRQHVTEVAERSARALRLVEGRPLDPCEARLGTVLAQAALLFDARFFFEVHELLEPRWIRAEGNDRAALQGLIQVAAGLHHLGNGNVPGTRALLHDGIAKLLDRELEGLPLGPFACALVGCLDEVHRLGADAPSRFDWKAVPFFPGRAQGVGRGVD